MIKDWIEAMRLRTLPVSVAGVVAGMAYAIMGGCFRPAAAIACLIFAVLAQIASNFANEYYDFKAGLDRPGREGPRRGVTEGVISPSAMKAAAWGTLAAACLVGLSLVRFGGWWLVPVGALIGIGAMAYSTGPWPLSRHGLGEVAVLCFFGILPVCLTYYVQAVPQAGWGAWRAAGGFDVSVLVGSVSIGLMGANVLIVNNYRDADDDAAVGKRTLAVILGRRTMAVMYLFNGYVAAAAMLPTWLALPHAALIVPGCYLAGHTAIWLRMLRGSGRQLNPLLGATSLLMAFYALGLLIAA